MAARLFADQSKLCHQTTDFGTLDLCGIAHQRWANSAGLRFKS